MVKRICDRCGKTLNDSMYFRLVVEKPPLIRVKYWSYPYAYDLCENCMEEIRDLLSVAQKTESITESDVDNTKGVENEG